MNLRVSAPSVMVVLALVAAPALEVEPAYAAAPAHESPPATGACPGANPEGCLRTGCSAGKHCDRTVGCQPSSCGCDVSGGWVCTPDCGGGTCVAN